MMYRLSEKHEKDLRPCCDGYADALLEMMKENDKVIHIDCDLMGCIDVGKVKAVFPDRVLNAGIAEANAIGSDFEQKTADMVSKWLVKNNLAKKYSAKRYQRLSEDDGARDEDFSDVVVEERKTGEKFFIECKEFERSNVLNLQFDIKTDG